jgi:hypothetical protein
MGKTARRARKKATGGSFTSNALGVRGGGVSRPTGAATDLEVAATMDVDANAGAGDVGPSGRGGDAVGEGKIIRALVAGSCVDACKAMDAALANGKTVSSATCVKVLALCQTRDKAKPALRMLQRMESSGMAPSREAMRCAFFACAKRGMLREALELMSRKDSDGRRYLGKDVLVRACAMTPGGVDGDLGLVLLESALRGVSFGSWEPGPTAVIRTQMPFTTSKAREDEEFTTALGAASARAADYPSGSFRMVCDNDGRRRPVDRLPLELYAPVHAGVIPFGPSGLTEAVRHDIPHVPGAFLITNFLSPTECAAVIAAGHSIGLRTDPGDVDGVTGASRLQYCEFMIWPQTIEDLWSRIADLMPSGAVGINARWRYFRYGPGTIYRRHVDGSWPQGALDEKGEYITDISEGKVRSRLTFLMYLTEGFHGGATTFYTATPNEPGVLSARGVVPQLGAVLCFPHGEAEESPVHEGSAVDASLSGEAYKYVIRTDVLFVIDK